MQFVQVKAEKYNIFLGVFCKRTLNIKCEDCSCDSEINEIITVNDNITSRQYRSSVAHNIFKKSIHSVKLYRQLYSTFVDVNSRF